MTRRQFLILVVALAVLAAAGAWLMQARRATWTSADARIGQRLLAELKLEDVAEVGLRDEVATVTLVRRDGAWFVKERAGFPADAERVRQIFLKLIELKIVQTESVAKEQRARLQLVEPGQGPVAGAGTLLEFRDGTGRTITRMLLGKKVMIRAAGAAPGAEQGAPTGRYVLSGADTVALVPEALAQAEAKPEAWLSKDLIRVERASSISAAGSDGKRRFEIARSSEATDWKLDRGDKPDSGKAQDVVSSLLAVNLVDVVADAAQADAALERPVVIRAQTFDGLTYTVKIGAKTADERYFLGISVEGDPAKVRPPGTDESAEQKDKLDKAFDERRAKLMEKLGRERKLDRWTYLVAATSIEPLLRVRAQLTPEKKPKDGKKA